LVYKLVCVWALPVPVRIFFFSSDPSIPALAARIQAINNGHHTGRPGSAAQRVCWHLPMSTGRDMGHMWPVQQSNPKGIEEDPCDISKVVEGHW